MSTAPQANQTSPLIHELATRWKMSPATMLNTIKATVFPQKDKKGNPIVVSNEQLMMFLQVAHQYDLNPFLKEICAFPTKSGGIVPMVPIDGWSNLINRRPEMDGLEFVDRWTEDGKTLISTTCIIYRKDRGHSTSITEYMKECFQPGDYSPWEKWPARMLRHKALIQCARVAFSLAGIYDPDEAQRIIEAEDARPEIIRPRAIDEPATTGALPPHVETEQVPHEVHRAQEPENVPVNTQAAQAEVQGVPVTFDSPKPEPCLCFDPGDNPQCPQHGQKAAPTTEKAQPEGPFVEKWNKLFVIAAGAGIKVVKNSHDDELHKVLKQKWGITSVKQIPVSLWNEVCETLGKSLAVQS